MKEVAGRLAHLLIASEQRIAQANLNQSIAAQVGASCEHEHYRRAFLVAIGLAGTPAGEILMLETLTEIRKGEKTMHHETDSTTL